MKPLIVIAPDKFKGSLQAWEAAESISRGLRGAGLLENQAELRMLPIADGGEGTAQVITHACGGEWVECRVPDALGRTIGAGYGLIRQDGKRVAVLEMSQAAGLWRLGASERGRRDASTQGVGEMIRDAIGRGVERILLGLGGSATNDGGSGMAQALGVRFLDGNGALVRRLPRELGRVRSVDFSGRLPLPEIVAACDVTNPLLGPQGCTRVFGPQKGVREEDMKTHEDGLRALAEAVARAGQADFSAEPGAGAAGGLGFGCVAFAGGRLERGFDMVAQALQLEPAIRASRLVITGEGSLDRQTLNGKGPHGVACLARKWGKPVMVFCGVWDGSEEVRREFGEIRSLKPENCTVDESIRRGRELLEASAGEAADWVFRQIAG